MLWWLIHVLPRHECKVPCSLVIVDRSESVEPALPLDPIAAVVTCAVDVSWQPSRLKHRETMTPVRSRPPSFQNSQVEAVEIFSARRRECRAGEASQAAQPRPEIVVLKSSCHSDPRQASHFNKLTSNFKFRL